MYSFGIDNKFLKYVIPIIVFSVFIIIGVYLNSQDKKADQEFYKLEIQGKVLRKKYIRNKKALYLQIDSNWYGLLDLSLESELSVGDSVTKNNDTDTILAFSKHKKNPYFSETAFLYIVKDSTLIKRLERLPDSHSR